IYASRKNRKRRPADRGGPGGPHEKEGMVFPQKLQELMNLYEWPHRIIREHENQHHPQIERILRSRGK
ncbi:MAG: hypothetical protein WBA34_09775, partial [Candidatus Deferrimicrobiaceae bacterium]